MPEAMKKLTAEMPEGKDWVVKITTDSLPLTLRDCVRLARAVKVAQKAHIREYNLKQYALRREAEKKQTSPQITGRASERLVK